MSLKLQFWIDVMWLAHPVLQLAVAVLMFRRKLQRRFKFFFIYLIFQVVTFPIVFYLSKTTQYYTAFFYTYWGTSAICQVLGFKIIHEIFLEIFKPYHTLKDLGSVLFQWAALVMLLVAGVIAAGAGPNTEPLVAAILTVERCVRVMQCGLIILLILFSKFLRISYKQITFGISAGFGIFAAIELMLTAWVAGGHSTVGTGLVNEIAYNCSILVWLVYVLLKEQRQEAAENLLIPQRWEQSFMDVQHPMPVDSLIPMFEDMVEQAISRVHDGPAAEAQPGPAADFEPTFQEKLIASLNVPSGSKELANSTKGSDSSPHKR